MKRIKSAVSPKRGQFAAILRIAGAVTFSGTIAGILITAIVKFLEYCLVPSNTLATLEKVLWGVGIPLTMVIVALYIFRTLRRRYSYSYMLDCYKSMRSEGDTCPRCGSTLSEKTGTGHYRAHVADKVTTTHYSNGSTSTSKEAVYENKSYSYQYYKCNNSACGISTEREPKFGNMPYSVKDLHFLILGEGNYKKSAASLVLGGGIILKAIIIFVLVVVLAIVGLTYRSNINNVYGAFGGDAEGINPSAAFGKEETKMMLDIRRIIKDSKEYGLSVAEQSTGLFADEKEVHLTHFVDEKLGTGTTVEFDGITSDSGLEGEYTIMPYNGKPSIFCDEDETIYPPDSEFYKTHYAALSIWDGKKIMNSLLDKIKSGELYENYTDMFVLRSEKLSVFIAEDGSVRLLDETGENPMRYTFTPRDTNKPVDYADYKLLGYEENETDELQKLLNKADYDADIEWYAGEECVGEIEVSDNGDGSYTFSNSYNPTDEIAEGKYVIYPNENRYEYYRYTNLKLYTLSETPEKHTNKENPDVYKWLSDMIPENFVKSHLNIDKAEKSSMLGLETTYTEDFGNGKKSVLEIEIGDNLSFKCYENETNYIEINW